MSKVYCILEQYNQDFVNVNDLKSNCDLIKVFKNEKNAFQYVQNELSFQCDLDDDWEYAIAEEKEDKIVFEIYYLREVQYRIIIKEMELN